MTALEALTEHRIVAPKATGRRRLALIALRAALLAATAAVAYRLGHAVGAWERYELAIAEANRESRRIHDRPFRETDWLPSTHPDSARRQGLM